MDIFPWTTQRNHYTEYISANPVWTLAGIYADEAISACNTKKRLDFHRLIDDCEAGKIDYIITKSVSRFARNTLDCLKYTRQLKEKNIAIFFEKENVISTDPKGELMLTIMASLAQEESRSTSENVKLGNQYRYQKGEIQINHNRFLGYTKDGNKKLVIEPEQAVVIKRIYREYLEGAVLDKDTEDIYTKLDELQNELLHLISNGNDYDRVANQIHELRAEKQNSVEYNVRRQSKRQCIAEMTEYLQGQNCLILEYSDSLTRQLVERVIVNEGTLNIEFKSGVEIEVVR